MGDSGEALIDAEARIQERQEDLERERAQKNFKAIRDPEKVRASVRRLFVSGRYRDISVRGVRQGDAVTLIFTGVPLYYV